MGDDKEVVDMRFARKEYEIEFFREKGYVRKQCPICGEYYWTLDKESPNCGESPCAPYRFIGEKVVKRSYTIDEMRTAFLKFFKQRNHEIIKPYPVVARWRDDLYLTIASIAVFQPFVTSGEVPPPANPLVISQPCIRLQDVDSVGLTGGRHLSIFEMGGHHAFNYPDKYVYWKNETVKYFHEFATEKLGIPEDEITYEEGVWEGGGNAGPDFEPIAYGLEIATLVFMQYKVVDGEYVELPLKIVDTGYGIERFTWLSQGSPSAFHAIYGNLVKALFDKVGIGDVDDEVFAEYTKLSSMILPPYNKHPDEVKELVARNLGLNIKDVVEVLRKAESVYALLDHTKTITFMLGDGLVPSNSGEGYLGRMMIRKALKHLGFLGLDVPLEGLVRLQIRLWSKTFRKLARRKNVILDMVRVEEERYRLSLSRGIEVVERLIKKKKGKIGLDELVELYDSHGVPPEVVKDVAAKFGVEVEIPRNFYSYVSEKHSIKRPSPHVEEKAVIDTSGLPPTRTLYYEDPRMTKFIAKILKVQDKYIILDQTAFYPEGGGQLSDKGYIIVDGQRYPVKYVFKIGDVIVHELSRSIHKIKPGIATIGEIDWERRSTLMRHHTATHVLLAAARRVLGDHVWQAGAHKDVDKARLDITHYKRLSSKEVKAIEKEANKIVLSDLKVKARFMERMEAEKKYGSKLYQGGVVPGRIIRVVSIDRIDHQACGGTHVERTGEIGLIKILRTERIQDGIVRLVFVAGQRALEEFQNMSVTIEEVAKILETQPSKLVNTARRTMEGLKLLRKEVERLREQYAEEVAKRLLSLYTPIGKLRFVGEVFEGLNIDDLIKLGEKVVKKRDNYVLILGSRDEKAQIVVMAGRKAVEKGIDSAKIIKRIAKFIGGGGGGRSEFAQGGGTNPDGLPKAIEEAERIVREVVG